MSTPTVKREDKAKLWSILNGKGWMMRKDIPMENRLIRAICQAEPEHFMSGQLGYKLVKEATDAEIEAGVADLRSRAKHIAERANGLECALHKRHGTQDMTLTEPEPESKPPPKPLNRLSYKEWQDRQRAKGLHP